MRPRAGCGRRSLRVSGAGKSESQVAPPWRVWRPRERLWASPPRRAYWVRPRGSSAVQAPLAMPHDATAGRRYSGSTCSSSGVRSSSIRFFSQLAHLPPSALARWSPRPAKASAARRRCLLHPRRRARPGARQVDDPRTIPFLKRFTVFNTDQCDGLADEVAILAPLLPEGMILPEVEALIRASGVASTADDTSTILIPIRPPGWLEAPLSVPSAATLARLRFRQCRSSPKDCACDVHINVRCRLETFY